MDRERRRHLFPGPARFAQGRLVTRPRRRADRRH